eukprot:7375910-Prymnesium_polylepis.1
MTRVLSVSPPGGTRPTRAIDAVPCSSPRIAPRPRAAQTSLSGTTPIRWGASSTASCRHALGTRKAAPQLKPSPPIEPLARPHPTLSLIHI